MVKCPKCQFLQPPDQYCAQCGVNMESYTPASVPLQRRLISSPAFYGFLLFIVVASTSYYIYDRVLVHIGDRGKSSGELDYSQVGDIDANRPDISEGLRPETRDASKEISDEDNPYSETTETQTMAAKTASRRINIYYIAAPQDSSLFQNADLKDAQVGVIPNFHESLKTAQDDEENESVQTLYEETLQLIGKTIPIEKAFGVRSTETENFGSVGLTLNLTVHSMTLGSVEIEPDFTTTFVSGTSENPRVEQESPQMGRFQIEQGQALFAFGLMPHRKPSEIESSLLPGAIVSLMESQEFQERATEFFVIIEYSN